MVNKPGAVAGRPRRDLPCGVGVRFGAAPNILPRLIAFTDQGPPALSLSFYTFIMLTIYLYPSIFFCSSSSLWYLLPLLNLFCFPLFLCSLLQWGLVKSSLNHEILSNSTMESTPYYQWSIQQSPICDSIQCNTI